MSGGVGGRLGQPRVLPESLGSDAEEPHPLQQSKKRPPFFPRRKNHLPQDLLRHISMPYTAIKVNAAFLRAHVDPLHRNQIREEPMETPTPPPIPPPIAPPQPPPAAPCSNEGRVIYNVLADKVGGVPNIRKRDNLYQALSILACVIIGAVVGVLLGGWPTGAGLGALAGTVGGLLISGVVLMVIGLIRKP
jgi:hypothetical protein